MDMRTLILKRLGALGVSRYRLAVHLKAKGQVSYEHTMRYLRHSGDLTGEKLGHVLEALGGKVEFDPSRDAMARVPVITGYAPAPAATENRPKARRKSSAPAR